MFPRVRLLHASPPPLPQSHRQDSASTGNIPASQELPGRRLLQATPSAHHTLSLDTTRRCRGPSAPWPMRRPDDRALRTEVPVWWREVRPPLVSGRGEPRSELAAQDRWQTTSRNPTAADTERATAGGMRTSQSGRRVGRKHTGRTVTAVTAVTARRGSRGTSRTFGFTFSPDVGGSRMLPLGVCPASSPRRRWLRVARPGPWPRRGLEAGSPGLRPPPRA